MKKFISRWIISALSIYFTSKILGFVYVADFSTTLVASFILGIINTFIKPIIFFLTIPINFLTLGLFSFIINGFMLYMASIIVEGFDVYGILGAVIASIVLSLFNMIFVNLFDLK
ncbi:putative membrane protein [Alkalithermobacter thermoalcaliphilus JW-YL-7 = DSM 7308]|uniref:Membrane protein n=1 Tax=Alkalithermobacter thermoalcaliphilus JW-YL-7 = DSM 7308 TaxID=1121328 RepID=A0A150FP71_CLOPD|nr:membrane protein of unknown function [[Clostridium] paradoxum JW-YL-7 = DSM 7308]SHK54061.1 putative membrane protein [[Clostridium] paradoxum JW-YL-7 = DSM 7308]